jgi:hypothetical protein
MSEAMAMALDESLTKRKARRASYPGPQQVTADEVPSAACIGGQGTVPYEQNTQQSPSSGLSSTPQLLHS